MPPRSLQLCSALFVVLMTFAAEARAPIERRSAASPGVGAASPGAIDLSARLDDLPHFSWSQTEPWSAPPPAATPMPMTPEGAQEAGFVVQVGVFADERNVERARSRLAALGPVRIEARRLGAVTATSVQVGPLALRSEAERLRAEASALGFPDARVATAR